MIEQLRLQEGRLFQNEKTLALYLDVKAVVYEAIVSASRADQRDAAFSDLCNFSGEDEDNKILRSFLKLAPAGMGEYHSKSLHDCVKIVANLLWPTEILLVARPKVTSLLSGVLRRLASQTIISAGQFLDLDPIKQDFLIREAFRRCLVNDCLVVFEESVPVTSKEIDLGSDEIGPDDSASHIGHDERPRGARSTIEGPRSTIDGPRSVVDGPRSTIDGPRSTIDGPRSVVDRSTLEATRSVLPVLAETVSESETDAPNQKHDDSKSSVLASKSMVGPLHGPKSTVGSVIGSKSVLGSVAPRLVASDTNSTASRASGTTATSIMRRALNVRKVHIESDN